jgi:hypothetical protein
LDVFNNIVRRRSGINRVSTLLKDEPQKLSLDEVCDRIVVVLPNNENLQSNISSCKAYVMPDADAVVVYRRAKNPGLANGNLTEPPYCAKQRSKATYARHVEP